jgi:hypothetical protein
MRAAVPLFAVLTFAPCVAWPQGNPLGSEFRVNTYATPSQALPSIASDSAGNFVVVWQESIQFDPAYVVGQRYSNSGSPLGDSFPVSTFGNNNAPSVASDPAGNFVVIWESEPGAGGLLGQRYSSSGAPLGGVFALGNSNDSVSPAVAFDPTGNFVVVWHNLFTTPGDSGSGVFGERYAGSGAPLGSFHANTYTTGSQGSPSVAAEASGNFVVVWSSYAQDGSGFGVFGQRFASSGAPLGSEFRVNTYTTSNQFNPSVAADPSGNFVVVWSSNGQDGPGLGLFGQRYAGSGAPLGPEFRVNTYTTNTQTLPSVAVDASGNLVVVWRSIGQDGSGDGVFGQRFAGSGDPLGPEFLVNTFTTNDQATPSVTADSFGDFVVVWNGVGLDDADGVFGQRYRPIVPVELMQLRVE